MITAEQFEILCFGEVRRAIEENIARDPVAVALDKRIRHAAEVATQVKYLQRARRKLPSWYEARCIIPPLAFEQSSGEECARRKRMEGDALLDLTCGLGVDAAAMAGRFRRVVAVERSEVLACVARENMRRLGIGNVEVVCDTAEHFVETSAERFDWCFADPDRRGADGSKKVLLEDCSPDMLRLLPRLADRADRVCIKMSPMFDVDEAFRLFGDCRAEVVSLGDECKEVLIYIGEGVRSLSAVAAGRGEFMASECEPSGGTACFDPAACGWVVLPDVALRKARLVRRYAAETLPAAFASGENGCIFCSERPADDVLGRVLAVESIERYDPKRLRREMRGRRPEILLRDVPLTLRQVEKAAGVHAGGDGALLFTSVGCEIWVIRLK